MTEIAFTPVPASGASDPVLRAQLLRTWVDVTDAGGAVGFVAPADRAAHAVALDASLARVVAGTDALGVLRRVGAPGGSDRQGAPGGSGDSGSAEDAREAVGMGLLVAEPSPLRAHWRTVLRVMVHPSLQGVGAGRVLLDGLHGMAASLGLEHLVLSVRGGLGLEGFYERLGYAVYGAHPGAIRLSADDVRDEVLMARRV